jgi:hypothetical protein
MLYGISRFSLCKNLLFNLLEFLAVFFDVMCIIFKDRQALKIMHMASEIFC